MTNKEKASLARNIAQQILNIAEDLRGETGLDKAGNVHGLVEALAAGAMEMQFRVHDGVPQSRFKITKQGAGLLRELFVEERANVTEH